VSAVCTSSGDAAVAAIDAMWRAIGVAPDRTATCDDDRCGGLMLVAWVLLQDACLAEDDVATIFGCDAERVEAMAEQADIAMGQGAVICGRRWTAERVTAAVHQIGEAQRGLPVVVERRLHAMPPPRGSRARPQGLFEQREAWLATSPHAPLVAAVLEAVQAVHGVTQAELLGSRRTMRLGSARRAAVYVLLLLSEPEMGRRAAGLAVGICEQAVAYGLATTRTELAEGRRVRGGGAMVATAEQMRGEMERVVAMVRRAMRGEVV
jgi:hypothetical protein